MRWLYARATWPGGSGHLQNLHHTAAALFAGALVPGGIQTYLRLYVLAVKLMVEDLENACADAAGAYYGVGTRRPDIRDAQFVYENTPPGTGMRRLMRERLALGLFRGRPSGLLVGDEWREVLNETPDLGFDLVREIAGFHWVAGGNAPARAVSGECTFHRHHNGEVCRAG